MLSKAALCAAGCLVLALAGNAARAAEYEIKAREIGAGSPHQTAQCKETLCFLDLPAKNAGTLRIAVGIANGAAFAHFMKGRTPLATDQAGGRTLEIPLASDSSETSRRIGLYLPHPSSKSDRQGALRNSPVLRLSGPAVAEVEIAIRKISD